MSGTLTWPDALWLARHRTPNDRLRFWGSAVSSGVAAAVVCSALGLIALGGGIVNSELGVVAEPGTRVGVVIAVFLVALPAVYLTAQTWKLGSVEQRERLLQLRDAGAGRRELRRVAVADALVPVVSGAAVGVVALGLVIALLNLRRAWLPLHRVEGDTLAPTGATGYVARTELLPNVAVVSWWPALVAVVTVSALAALAAALSVSRVSRQVTRRRTLVGATAALMARRASRPEVLLALRRIAQEPRATTRPAMLLGLAAFVAATSTWLSRLFLASEIGFQDFYRQSFDLVTITTWLGIGLCALGLVVTLTDAVLRRRRADAAAVAGGTPIGVLRRALVLQAVLPAVLPVLAGLGLGGLAGVVLTRGQMATAEDGGSGPFIPLPWLAWAGWGVGLLVVAGGAALIASTALGRTTQVDQLRITA